MSSLLYRLSVHVKPIHHSVQRPEGAFADDDALLDALNVSQDAQHPVEDEPDDKHFRQRPSRLNHEENSDGQEQGQSRFLHRSHPMGRSHLQLLSPSEPVNLRRHRRKYVLLQPHRLDGLQATNQVD